MRRHIHIPDILFPHASAFAGMKALQGALMSKDTSHPSCIAQSGSTQSALPKICMLFHYIHPSVEFIVLVHRNRPGISPKMDALRNLYEGKKIIVGRDKLDVVKGILQKVANSLMRSSSPLYSQSRSCAPLRNSCKTTQNGWATLS